MFDAEGAQIFGKFVGNLELVEYLRISDGVSIILYKKDFKLITSRTGKT